MARFRSVLPSPLVQTPAGDVQFEAHVAVVDDKSVAAAVREAIDGPLAFLGIVEEKPERPAAKRSKAKRDESGETLGDE